MKNYNTLIGYLFLLFQLHDIIVLIFELYVKLLVIFTQ